MQSTLFPLNKKPVLRNIRQKVFTVPGVFAAGLVASAFILPSCNLNDNAAGATKNNVLLTSTNDTATQPAPAVATFDTAEYNLKLTKMVNGDTSGRWPVKTVYPKAGALLP